MIFLLIVRIWFNCGGNLFFLFKCKGHIFLICPLQIKAWIPNCLVLIRPNLLGDALRTPWGTQIWVPNWKHWQSKESGPLHGSQHFKGVEGRVGAPGWD
jgi:hypothetical protein